jgi:hypothetical protein
MYECPVKLLTDDGFAWYKARKRLATTSPRQESQAWVTTLNIEHEDALVNSVEGVGRATDLLKQVVLVEPPDWTPADV